MKIIEGIPAPTQIIISGPNATFGREFKIVKKDSDKQKEYLNLIFSESVISFVIPQFEGLNKPQRDNVEKFLNYVFEGEENSNLVIKKLNDMKSYFS